MRHFACEEGELLVIDDRVQIKVLEVTQEHVVLRLDNLDEEPTIATFQRERIPPRSLQSMSSSLMAHDVSGPWLI